MSPPSPLSTHDAVEKRTNEKLKDAAKEADKQRERLIEMQRVFEAKRHELMEQESSLRAKQSELENSIFRTKQKEVCERYQTRMFLAINSSWKLLRRLRRLEFRLKKLSEGQIEVNRIFS